MVKIRKNIVLAPYTTFRIGGPANFFAEVKSVRDLTEALDFSKKKKLPHFILGGGSNILMPDKGINGLVIKIDIKGLGLQERKGYVLLSVGAGERWDKIVAAAVRRNLGGVENLSLIPGTVGGAVYQNIGAYGSELKDVLKDVEILDTESGRIKRLSSYQCNFRYRSSIFQQPGGKKYIILRATLRLFNDSAPKIVYPDLIKYFRDKRPNIAEVRKAVVTIRRSKLVYPTGKKGSAGSFFKNPVVTIPNYQKIITNYPDIRGRDIGNGRIKLSGGQLIEKAGWKGKRFNNVGISQKHALVLVNYGKGKADDILKLALLIQNSVKSKFGVSLKPEVQIIA